jgi:hypothetical protein
MIKLVLYASYLAPIAAVAKYMKVQLLPKVGLLPTTLLRALFRMDPKRDGLRLERSCGGASGGNVYICRPMACLPDALGPSSGQCCWSGVYQADCGIRWKVLNPIIKGFPLVRLMNSSWASCSVCPYAVVSYYYHSTPLYKILWTDREDTRKHNFSPITIVQQYPSNSSNNDIKTSFGFGMLGSTIYNSTTRTATSVLCCGTHGY